MTLLTALFIFGLLIFLAGAILLAAYVNACDGHERDRQEEDES